MFNHTYTQSFRHIQNTNVCSYILTGIHFHFKIKIGKIEIKIIEIKIIEIKIIEIDTIETDKTTLISKKVTKSERSIAYNLFYVYDAEAKG